MSSIYDEQHRFWQDRHGSRHLADRLEEQMHSEFSDDERSFIEAATMLFIATADERGHPTVSYKGGAPNFVRVVGKTEIIFPNYDGNGMFLSLGNINRNKSVGLLFIDFDRPRRLRIQGDACVATSRQDLAVFPGADAIVRVTARQIFPNCGRYIHHSRGMEISKHVPDGNGRQPFPAWKRLDIFKDVISDDDRRRVIASGGTIDSEHYEGE